MNIHEAAKSGLPFRHPDMIGAWVIVGAGSPHGGGLIHRDNINDFSDMEWIKDNCWPDNDELYWMNMRDLLRTDWETIVIDHSGKGVTVIRKF